MALCADLIVAHIAYSQRIHTHIPPGVVEAG